MADNRIEIQFGAVLDALKDGLDKAVSTVSQSTDKITASVTRMNQETGSKIGELKQTIIGHFDGIKSAVAQVQTAILGIGAVLAGGAMFREVIHSYESWLEEAHKLSIVLGMNLSDASALNIALKEIGMSSEAYIGMTMKLNRQLKANEGSLNEIGVATRDSSGQLLDQQTIMMNAIKTLNGYKEGTDRNQAALYLFGRSAMSNINILRLTEERIERTKQLQKELGIEVGEKGVEQQHKFEEALADGKLVIQAMEMQVAKALMPVLTDLGKWLTSVGPDALTIFGGALKGVITFVMVLNLGLRIILDVIGAAIAELYRLGKMAYQVLTFDFSGAKATWQEFGSSTRNALIDIEKQAVSTGNALARMWGLSTGTEAVEGGGESGRQFKAPGESGESGKGKSGAASSIMAQWQEELQAAKVAYETEQALQGTWEKWSLTQTLNYWGEKLSQVKEGSKEYNEVMKKLFDTQLQMLKEDRKAHQERDKELGKSLQGLKEYQDRYAEAMKQQIKDQDEAIAQKAVLDKGEIDLEKQKVETMKQLDQLTEQEKIEALKLLAEKEYQIDMQALFDRIALYRDDTKEYKKYLDDILKLKQKHELDMQKLTDQSTIAQKKDYDDLKRTVQGYVSQVTSSMMSAVRGMLTGTQTLAQGIRGIFEGLLDIVLGVVEKMLTEWIAKNLIMKSVSAATATAEIGNDAVSAAGGAYKAVVGIPVIGPILAPPAAAAAFAAVMAFSSSIASAAGGYDIPAGYNPVVQAHAEEMMLPKDIAKPLREMVSGGGGGGGTFTFKGIKPDHLYRGRDFLKALKHLERQGHLRTVFER